MTALAPPWQLQPAKRSSGAARATHAVRAGGASADARLYYEYPRAAPGAPPPPPIGVRVAPRVDAPKTGEGVYAGDVIACFAEPARADEAVAPARRLSLIHI